MLTVVVLALLVIGVAMRAAILHGSTAANSDEAVVGLMARHMLHGEWVSFYWGQDYGGSLEPTLVAGVFAVAGPSELTLKLVPLILSAVGALLVWRIGRRILGAEVGALAGALFWAWPFAYVWWSTQERGFYWAILVAGLVCVLAALRAAETPNRWGSWATFGLAAGLGWWSGPQIMFFLAPSSLWLMWTLRERLWRSLAAVPFAAVGAAPWIIHNVHHHLASLRLGFTPVPSTYQFRLSVFVTHGLPTTLGLQYQGKWIRDGVGQLLYGLALIAIVVALVRLTRRGGPAILLLLLLVLFPFIHAISPISDYVGEGRYTVFLSPTLALALVTAGAGTIALESLVTGLAAVSIAGYLVWNPGPAPHGVESFPAPPSPDPVASALLARGVHRAVAGYWTAYRLSFISDEQIIATPYDTIRYKPYFSEVQSDPAPAVVFAEDSREERAYRAKLLGLHVEATRLVINDYFAIYLPQRSVWPDLLPAPK